jgi:5-methyltetrahydrofolate--homocysteine methyltransferase
MGEAARQLYEDAREMLARIVEEKWLTAQGVIGFFPANAVGDDIVIYKDEMRKEPLTRLHTLRQQIPRRDGRACMALADFVAPASSGVADYVGAFVVTAGVGEAEKSEQLKGANNDYDAILLKALADRLAEAFAERLHERVRREFWGYASDENLSNEDLIAEQYRGIRPAPGYPAQPDHTEKATLFQLLDAEKQAGVMLTESYAMWPGAAVSGLYFSHPDSAYFGVGRIDRDQIEDYAARKGWKVEEAERWLSPILSYDPARVPKVAAE